MQFVIDQDNDNQFHWRIVGDDGAYSRSRPRALPSPSKRAAPPRTCTCTAATGFER
jgi:hypothetical protein